MSGDRYPTQVIKRAHKQREGRNYHKYRPCLRLEFGLRCVYCRTAEVEVKPIAEHGGFEIDHFRPVKRFESLEFKYKNLYWSCPECNRVKAQKWPSPAEVRKGFRFVDVCNDNASEHLEVVGFEVRPKSLAGEYTIDEIQLNSVVHQERRKDRKKMIDRLTVLIQLATTDDARNAAISMLEEIKGEPWDTPTSCLCGPRTRAGTGPSAP